MVKRLSFDRPTTTEIDDATLMIIRDKERLDDEWERVYTSVSMRVVGTAPTKLRFGTGGEDQPKWHLEEPSPIQDVVYTACKEYHCRRHDRGIVGIYGGTLADNVFIVWHGYDKLIGER